VPYMTWESLLNSPQPTAAGAPLASSTTLTDISVVPQFTLPANFLQAGSALRFTAYGVFSTTATPTLLLGVYYGGVAGVALATTGAIATGSGVTNVPWRIELLSTVRTVGTAGTAISQGLYSMGTSVSAWNHLPIPNIALATVAVDTTAAKVLSIGAQWGTSSASNTITLHGFAIESVGV
jgi:hypothetical protein